MEKITGAWIQVEKIIIRNVLFYSQNYSHNSYENFSIRTCFH